MGPDLSGLIKRGLLYKILMNISILDAVDSLVAAHPNFTSDVVECFDASNDLVLDIEIILKEVIESLAPWAIALIAIACVAFVVSSKLQCSSHPRCAN